MNEGKPDRPRLEPNRRLHGTDGVVRPVGHTNRDDHSDDLRVDAIRIDGEGRQARSPRASQNGSISLRGNSLGHQPPG